MTDNRQGSTTTTRDLIRIFGRIGLLSFGGPAAQIALMHQELVEKRDWLTEDQFLRALSFCMLLPGPEAMQLATYAGWKRAGIGGGLIGGGLFILPGAIVISALALAYGQYGGLDWVQSLFLGIKATVIAIVIEALIKISKRALKSKADWACAIAAFLALFAFKVPFPIIIALAAIIGALQTSSSATAIPAKATRTLPILCIGLALWALPIIILAFLNQSFLLDLSLFFSKLAIVTFGGAYAVLAYMTQEVVGTYGWLTTTQMIDALGLAETTPGPLILVTQFVAMVAGMAKGGTTLAIFAGAITLWVTFVPCFIWIFAGAPLIDWLEGRPRLQSALARITAAVVGVIANLSLWFALHVFFSDINSISYGPIQTITPTLSSASATAISLALLAGYLLIKRHWPLPLVLSICAISALLLGILP